MIEWRDLRRWFAWAAAVAMASAAMCDAGPWASDKAGSANFAPLSMNAIDRFVSDHLSSDSVPGLALAITQGDRILLVKGYGMARQGAPVTADTQFFIASLSKSFTALAVMQLVDAGQLNLDAPVQRYLPGFGLSDAKAATRITIRQLLNQTSGLADTGFPEGRLPPPATIRQRVATLRRARPVSAPGTAFHYFNPNYAVLARLVEKVSGVPFGDYLHTHIFKPLDMRNTFHAVTSTTAYAKATDLAQGHLALCRSLFGNERISWGQRRCDFHRPGYGALFDFSKRRWNLPPNPACIQKEP